MSGVMIGRRIRCGTVIAAVACGALAAGLVPAAGAAPAAATAGADAAVLLRAGRERHRGRDVR
jgi:hypothetical protein